MLSPLPTPQGELWPSTVPKFTSPFFRDNPEEDWNSLGLLPNLPGKRIIGPVYVGCLSNLLWWGRARYSSHGIIRSAESPKMIGYNHVNLGKGQFLKIDERGGEPV